MSSLHLKQLSFHDSIKTFNIPQIRDALERDKSSLNTQDPKIGWTALYKTIVYGQKEICEFLLASGSDPNLPNRIGETPLHYAVETGSADFVSILIKYGADPNYKQSVTSFNSLTNQDGDTVLHTACKRGNTEVLKLLLSAKVDVNVQNKFGKTPLHIAGDVGLKEIFQILVEKGADVNAIDKWKRKPRNLLDSSSQDSKEKVSTESTKPTNELKTSQVIRKSLNDISYYVRPAAPKTTEELRSSLNINKLPLTDITNHQTEGKNSGKKPSEGSTSQKSSPVQVVTTPKKSQPEPKKEELIFPVDPKAIEPSSSTSTPSQTPETKPKQTSPLLDNIIPERKSYSKPVENFDLNEYRKTGKQSLEAIKRDHESRLNRLSQEISDKLNKRLEAKSNKSSPQLEESKTESRPSVQPVAASTEFKAESKLEKVPEPKIEAEVSEYRKTKVEKKPILKIEVPEPEYETPSQLFVESKPQLAGQTETKLAVEPKVEPKAEEPAINTLESSSNIITQETVNTLEATLKTEFESPSKYDENPLLATTQSFLAPIPSFTPESIKNSLPTPTQSQEPKISEPTFEESHHTISESPKKSIEEPQELIRPRSTQASLLTKTESPDSKVEESPSKRRERESQGSQSSYDSQRSSKPSKKMTKRDLSIQILDIPVAHNQPLAQDPTEQHDETQEIVIERFITEQDTSRDRINKQDLMEQDSILQSEEPVQAMHDNSCDSNEVGEFTTDQGIELRDSIKQSSPVLTLEAENYKDVLPTAVLTPRDKTISSFQTEESEAKLKIFSEVQPLATEEMIVSASRARVSIFMDIQPERMMLDQSIMGLPGPAMNLLEEWLRQMGLESLMINFVDNGYNELEKFKKDYFGSHTLFGDLLHRFGVDKYGHRVRILIKAREEVGLFKRRGIFCYSEMNNGRKLVYPEMDVWLQCIGLEELSGNFSEAGLDSLEYLIFQSGFSEAKLTEDVLRDELGVNDKTVRKELVNRLRTSKFFEYFKRVVYDIGCEMDPTLEDSKKFFGLLTSKTVSNKCEIF